MEINQSFMSEQIDQLATALAKAQGEYSVAFKSRQNPFFKSTYADFESVVSASRPALSKYNLSVVQSVLVIDGQSCLVSILMHSSGQWIKSIATHNPLKADIQSLSSYNTYLKRMCYASLVGVVTSDEDDDGEGAVDHHKSMPAPQPYVAEKLSREQIELLEEQLDGFPEIAKDVLRGFNISTLDQIPKAKYTAVINRITEIKRSLEK